MFCPIFVSFFLWSLSSIMVTSLDKRELVTLLSFVCGSVLSVMVCLLILLVSLVRYFLPEHFLFYLFLYKRLLNYFSSVKHN